MKKILRIITRINIGGPAIHAIYLTEGLNGKKYKSILVTGTVSDSEGDMSYLALEKGVRPVVIKEMGEKISLWRDFIALWKIFKLLKRENPDIVHTHTSKAGMLGSAAVILFNFLNLRKTGVGRRKRIKLIHTFHGNPFHGYFGRLKTRVYIYISRTILKFTDRVIVICPQQAVDISEKYNIVPRGKLAVIPLGFDLKKILNINSNGKSFRKKINAQDDAILIGIVGRLVPIKNHKMLLDSIKIIKNQPLEYKIKFIIIGDGELRTELNNYADFLGIKELVYFSGWQKGIESVFAELDIVALTSINEGTPVSLIEAMASSKAVVATKVGGVADLMGSYRGKTSDFRNLEIFDNGILVNSGDAKGLSDALTFLINDKDLREQMGARGKLFVKERFAIERLINDMEKLYESVYDSKGIE